MDAYLDCLYQHISENLFQDARLSLLEYSRWSACQDAAWKALVESLSHEQLKLVEEYWAACDGKRYLEEKLLFQKAVALGKWMARA